MEYGIGVRNRYELFYDEDGDPLELIAKQEEERKKAQAERKLKAVEAAKLPKIVPATQQTTKKENGNVKTVHPPSAAQKQTRDNHRPRESFGEKKPKEDARQGEDRRRRMNPEDNKDRKLNGRGPRPPKGIRREGNEKDARPRNERPPKPENVVNGDETKTGKSPGNLNATEADVNDNKLEEKQTASDETETPNPEDAAEAEATEKTLEQWKKEMEAKKSKASYDANIRKPNEGGADPKWDKMKVIKKKKENEQTSATTANQKSNQTAQENQLDEEDRKLKRLEETLSKQFHFSDSRGNSGNSGAGNRSGRNGRPGTGNPKNNRGLNNNGSRSGQEYRGDQKPTRGSRAHNGHANHPQKNPTPRVEDLNDFPSLAA